MLGPSASSTAGARLPTRKGLGSMATPMTSCELMDHFGPRTKKEEVANGAGSVIEMPESEVLDGESIFKEGDNDKGDSNDKSDGG